MQIWTGYDWQPGFNQTWPLGDLTNEEEDSVVTPAVKGPVQKVLGFLEL